MKGLRCEVTDGCSPLIARYLYLLNEAVLHTIITLASSWLEEL